LRLKIIGKGRSLDWVFVSLQLLCSPDRNPDLGITVFMRR
jgi:hypothetical protein